MTIDVRQFGASPGSGNDACGPAARALESVEGRSGVTLLFPRGRYDFFGEAAPRRPWSMSNSDWVPLRRFGILLEGGADAAIDGDGSTFVFHAPMSAIGARGVNGVTVRNVTIDFEPPFNADAEVLESGPGRVLFRIDPARHPFSVRAGSLWFTGQGWSNRWNGEAIEFESGTRLIPPGTGDRSLGYGRYACAAVRKAGDRVALLGPLFNPPSRGNVVVLRHGMRDHAGMFFDRCRNVRVEHCAVHSTSGLGILFQRCETITMQGVRSEPASGRYHAGHDDGAHVAGCRGLVSIEDCTFAGLMDDPINVHGTTTGVRGRQGSTVRARFMHGQSIGLEFARPGDRIAFLRRDTMETIGEGVVGSFHPVDARLFDVTFEGEIPDEVGHGSAMENLTWSPDVRIAGCDFRHCRARGILVSTPGRILVEDNRIESSGSAILVAGDANTWYESGAVRDLTIRGNTFTEHCLTNRYQYCEAVISICPVIPRPRDGAFFHRGIRIEGNSFELFDYPLLYALSVSGLTVRDNTLRYSDAHAPWHRRRSTLTFERCKDILVQGNSVDPRVLGKNVALAHTDGSAVVIAGGQGLTLRQGPEA